MGHKGQTIGDVTQLPLIFGDKVHQYKKCYIYNRRIAWIITDSIFATLYLNKLLMRPKGWRIARKLTKKKWIRKDGYYLNLKSQ